MNHAENTGTQGVGKISWFVGLPKVKASLRLMVGLPVGLGLKPLLSSGLVLKIYRRHISQEGDGELEGVSRDLGEAAGVREGLRGRAQGWARLWVQWKNGTCGWLKWDCINRSGATKVCRADSQGTSCVSTIKTSSDLTENVLSFHHKNQFGSHRELLCFHHKNHFEPLTESRAPTTKTNSDLTEKAVFQPKNQFERHRERLVFPPQKPVRTSQRKACVSNIKTSSNLTESVLCSHHKNQFEPHRKSLVFPP